MHHRTLPRLGRWTPIAAAAILGSAVFAAPSNAAVANISDIIEVSSNTSEVLIGGVENANVELRRNGVVIATGAATGPVGGGEAGLNSDHAPGGCWDGFVPQMLPGDEVHNVTNTDFIVLGDVKVTSPVTEENGAVVFRGTVGGPLPAGHALDATLDPATEGFRWEDGSSGGQFLSAGAGNSGGSITEHGDGTWTARFVGLSGVEKQQALGGSPGASVGMEHDVGPTGGEVTAFHFGATPGGHGGCTEPYAPNEVSGFDRAAVNSGNAGSALVVNGASQPGVTSVLVTLTDKDGKTATQTVTPAGGSWSASIAAGDFADGPVEATLQMTMAGGQFAGVGKTITKDTVAPGAPTASVAPGTYQSAVNVALAGENVRYTTDGSTPTAASPAYGSAIQVNRSQTLKAVSVDAAGNTSSVAEFGYTIQAPAAAVAWIVRAPVVRAPGIAAPARLRLASLSVARNMRLRTARRNGVRVRFLAPDGAKAVRVRLRRGNKTIASVVRRVTRDGVLQVVLPRTSKQRRALRRGTYRVQITPGTSTRKLDGLTSTRRVTLR
jgi:hypothetical protein